MKKHLKPLSLNRETLHLLQGQLSKVAGQTVANSCVACSVTAACTNCTVCNSLCMTDCTCP